jgi:hypothetical protein
MWHTLTSWRNWTESVADTIPEQIDHRCGASFAGELIFVVRSTPAHVMRQSRRCSTFTLTFQPRWVLKRSSTENARLRSPKYVSGSSLRQHQPSPLLDATVPLMDANTSNTFDGRPYRDGCPFAKLAHNETSQPRQEQAA